MAKNDKNLPLTSVKALVPVDYDGTLYGPGLPDGDTLDVRQQDVEQLRSVGAVKVIPAANPVPTE